MTIDVEHLAVGVVVRAPADTVQIIYGGTRPELEGPRT
jgi:hypothetical protein